MSLAARRAALGTRKTKPRSVAEAAPLWSVSIFWLITSLVIVAVFSAFDATRGVIVAVAAVPWVVALFLVMGAHEIATSALVGADAQTAAPLYLAGVAESMYARALGSFFAFSLALGAAFVLAGARRWSMAALAALLGAAGVVTAFSALFVSDLLSATMNVSSSERVAFFAAGTEELLRWGHLQRVVLVTMVVAAVLVFIVALVRRGERMGAFVASALFVAVAVADISFVNRARNGAPQPLNGGLRVPASIGRWQPIMLDTDEGEEAQLIAAAGALVVVDKPEQKIRFDDAELPSFMKMAKRRVDNRARYLEIISEFSEEGAVPVRKGILPVAIDATMPAADLDKLFEAAAKSRFYRVAVVGERQPLGDDVTIPYLQQFMVGSAGVDVWTRFGVGQKGSPSSWVAAPDDATSVACSKTESRGVIMTSATVSDAKALARTAVELGRRGCAVAFVSSDFAATLQSTD